MLLIQSAIFLLLAAASFTIRPLFATPPVWSVNRAELCDLPVAPYSQQDERVLLQTASELVQDLEELMESKIEAFREHPEFIADIVDLEFPWITVRQFKQKQSLRGPVADEICRVYLNELVSYFTHRDSKHTLQAAITERWPRREFAAIYATELRRRFSITVNWLFHSFLDGERSRWAKRLPREILGFLKQLVLTRIVEWNRMRMFAPLVGRLREKYPLTPEKMWLLVDEFLSLGEIMHYLSPLLLQYSPASYVAVRFHSLALLNSLEARESLQKRMVDELDCVDHFLARIPQPVLREQALEMWDSWKDQQLIGNHKAPFPESMLDFFRELSGFYDRSELSTYPIDFGETPIGPIYRLIGSQLERDSNLVRSWAEKTCQEKVRSSLFRLPNMEEHGLDTPQYRVLGRAAVDSFRLPCPSDPQRRSLEQIYFEQSEGNHFKSTFMELKKSMDHRVEEIVDLLESPEMTQEKAEDANVVAGADALVAEEPKPILAPPLSHRSDTPRQRRKPSCNQKLPASSKILFKQQPNVILKPSNFLTLCLLFGRRTGQVSWDDFLRLVGQMGGAYKPSSGSRTRIFLYGRSAILDKPHPNTKLLNGKLYTARRLLEKTFGVDMDAFELL